MNIWSVVRPGVVGRRLPSVLRTIALVTACSGLGGCAYLTTFNKQISLDGYSAVAMDVKQRVVFSQKLPATKENPDAEKFTVTCAEPSPDALTVIGSSAGLSFSDASGAPSKTINLSAALSESGAFVGLRTQSIQLLRDQLYRLCEGYASGAVNDAEFKAMQRRFQSTVLGLLAIEQLTKPVVAGQALLSASAQSSAGAGVGDATVTAAQQRVDAQKDKVTQAQNTANTKNAAVDKDRNDIADNSNKITEASKDGATPPDALVTADKDLRDKLRADTAEADNAKRSAAQEEQTLREDQASLAEAKTKSSASASAGGQLGEVARSSAASTDSLGRIIREIVNDVNAAYTRDECVEFLQRQNTRGTADAMGHLEKRLKEVTTTDVSKEREQALAAIGRAQFVCEEVVRAGLLETSKRLDIRLKELDLNLEKAKFEARKFELAQAGGQEPAENPPAGPAEKKAALKAAKPVTKGKDGKNPDAPAGGASGPASSPAK